jgi:hypothetical protein
MLQSLLLVGIICFAGFSAHPAYAQTNSEAKSLLGRWQVKFSYTGLQKSLVFESQAKGSGSFRLLDTGPGDKAELPLHPAVWSQLTNDRVSFSGEVELPIGTCCLEIGTLTFKGKFTSTTTISGKLVFVTSVDEDEGPTKLRTVIGSFTATRLR